MKKRTLVAGLLAVVLVLTTVIGGTLAWLTAKTDAVVNTFTVGNIDIALEETTGEEYKMVPGTVLSKDPVATVEGGSEACWLFVEVNNSANLEEYVSFKYVTDWNELAAENSTTHKVLWRKVAASDADQDFPILLNDQVKIGSDVTKAQIDALYNEQGAVNAELLPTMSFTAYAIQQDNLDLAGSTEAEQAAEAWTMVKAAAKP